MEAQVTKRLFTVEEYHEMGKAGILHEDDRVELIDGEILQMSAIGHRHMVCVNRATTLFIQAFGNRAVVSTQNPVRLTEWTEPQPDLVVFKPRSILLRFENGPGGYRLQAEGLPVQSHREALCFAKIPSVR